MTRIEKICYFLGITKKTWYNWKDEERLITKYIERYVPIEHIDTFIENEKIPELESNDLFYTLSLNDYDNYLEPILDNSLESLYEIDFYKFTTENIKGILNEIHIFILFEYIFNYYATSIEEKEGRFGNEIFSIMKQNNNSKYEIREGGLQYIYMANKSVLEIINYFQEYKDFSLYYGYSNHDRKYLNLHSFFHKLYLKVKEIMSLSADESKKIELLKEELLTLNFDSKKNYLNC